MVHLRRFGVPPGGAADQESYRACLALAHQPEGTAVWELALGSADFEAEEECSVVVTGATRGSYLLAKGERLTVSVGRTGCRSYVCDGPPLMPGMATAPESLNNDVLRIIPGPQADLVPSIETVWRVSPDLDRVGVRLQGSGKPHQIELVSEPACPGAIQVTPDGQLIILGPDGPTIGGYPKAAVVCSADLDKVAQLRPGQKVTFRLISIEEARSLKQGPRQS